MLFVHLTLEIRIVRGQLVELDQIARSLFQPVPAGYQLTVIGCLPRHLAGARGIVPDPGLNELKL
jgi:hypothetical protein